MNSRDSILVAVRANQPEKRPAPDLPVSLSDDSNLIDTFKVSLEAAAGKVLSVKKKSAIAEAVAKAYPDAMHVASAIPDVVPGSVDLTLVVDPHDLQSVDLMVCRGELGIAENGAIWIAESALIHRAAPFIAAHLVVVLEKSAIVADMHAAYDQVDIDREGFGVFMAGPSKTADIEQALVIGAHGPKSLTAILVG